MRGNDISNTVAKRLWFVVEGYLYDEEALYTPEVKKHFWSRRSEKPTFVLLPGSTEVLHRLMWSISIPIALATFVPPTLFEELERRIEYTIGAPVFRFESPLDLARQSGNILSTWAICDADKMRSLTYGGAGLHLPPGEAPLGT